MSGARTEALQPNASELTTFKSEAYQSWKIKTSLENIENTIYHLGIGIIAMILCLNFTLLYGFTNRLERPTLDMLLITVLFIIINAFYLFRERKLNKHHMKLRKDIWNIREEVI